MSGEREVSHDTRNKVGGPDALHLIVCRSCARTDRLSPLKARHYDHQGICPGPVERVLYVRASVDVSTPDPNEAP